MNVLSSTFWGEGPADERFMPKIIGRVIEAMLFGCARGEWEVLEPIVLQTQEQHFADQVTDIARQSAGFTITFIHTDADASDEDQRAMPYKIEPALSCVRQLSDEQACKNIVAVIPVTKIENWKLVDMDALSDVLGVKLNRESLGLNIPPRTLEQRSNSKQLLSDVLNTAIQQRGKRKNTPTLADIDELLAKKIPLESLARLDSFKRFANRLKNILIKENIIRDDCDVFAGTGVPF